MDSHKRNTQLERLEVVETGAPAALVGWREAADCDRELSSAARDIVDNQTSWHIALVADDLAALVRSRAD
jgi:hypothetical protein